MRTHYSYRRLTIFLLVCLLSCASATLAQTTKSPLPPPTPGVYVYDYANVIDPATKSRLETILTNLYQRAQIQFIVVTVRTTGDQPIFDYSLAVARGWRIGPSEGEKDGALLLVAIDDRKYQMQVSRHLEGDLPDGLVGEIGRRMRDPFRAGDYSAGISNAVQTFVATLAEKRGFNIEGIDQQNAYHPAPSSANSNNAARGLSPICLVFIIIIVLLIIFRGGRGGGSGCLNLLLLNALFNSGRGGGGSGWSGGGFGGSGGGGGGGGFGGFGGGDFGGGGAGGSW